MSLTKIQGSVLPLDAIRESDGYKLIGEVDSVSSLRLIEPFIKNQKIKITGYYSDSTIGGGEFYYDSTDTTSSDNSGTIIVTSSGKRWKRVLSNQGRFNLEMFGIKIGDDLSIKLPNMISSVIALGGGTIVFPLNASYVLSNTINLDIGFVNIEGNGSTINCNNPSGTYAFEVTSSAPNPYGSPLRNRLLSTNGLYLLGNTRTNNGINLKGNGTKKPAQFCMYNLVITQFNIGINCQQNAYMFEFDHCSLSRNNISVNVPADAGDSGERMTWINCDFTSNLYTEGDASTQSYAMKTNSACTLRYVNCSFDWMWCLMDIINTQVFMENCHLESPSGNFITNSTNTYKYIIAKGTSVISINNSFILLNYAQGSIQPKVSTSVAYLESLNTKFFINNSFVHIFGISWWGNGAGKVVPTNVVNYNEFAPLPGISDSYGNNTVANGHFRNNTWTPASIGWSASFTGTGPTADDMTYSTEFVYDSSPYSLKCYNQFAGTGSAHSLLTTYRGSGRYYIGEVTVYTATTNNIIINIKREFMDEFDNLLYTDTDNTQFGVSGNWSSRRRILDLYSLGVVTERIKKVKITLTTNNGNANPFYIGRVISQSY